MSGLSDVRLVLHSQELQAQTRSVKAAPANAPEPISRWKMFWIRVRTRRQLLELTDMELRDIGLTPSQARFEGTKRFWQS